MSRYRHTMAITPYVPVADDAPVDAARARFVRVAEVASVAADIAIVLGGALALWKVIKR